MKKSLILSMVLSSLMYGFVNPLPVSSKAIENGGTLSAIDAYQDGVGAMLIQDGRGVDNSAMNTLVFKYGSEAKENNLWIGEQVLLTGTDEEKILEKKLTSAPFCNDTSYSFDGTTCSKIGPLIYDADFGLAGYTLSGNTNVESYLYLSVSGNKIYTNSINNYVYIDKDKKFYGSSYTSGIGNHKYIKAGPNKGFQLCSTITGCGAEGFINSSLGITSSITHPNSGNWLFAPGLFKINESTFRSRFYASSTAKWDGAIISFIPYNDYFCSKGGLLSDTTCTLNNTVLTQNPMCKDGYTLIENLCIHD